MLLKKTSGPTELIKGSISGSTKWGIDGSIVGSIAKSIVGSIDRGISRSVCGSILWGFSRSIARRAARIGKGSTLRSIKRSVIQQRTVDWVEMHNG